ncbi:MAG: nitrile hydratase subunit alpha [Gammaproteobacteria bacterium]|nr:nitrile hydratase subunit alpha [Gammaproteobacteria bacterium]MDE0039159.1 nitrile hydratase subunit alpha [Gammaproteobacteria bacterium]MDE0441473.1 nitrile hydratase subunit alpha [Gammaproteobacteria bacterium]
MSDTPAHPGLQHHVPLPGRAKRAIAIHRLLVSKNIVGPDEVRETIDRARRRTPADGARVVARAWTDPAFKARLMADARPAVFELGYRLSRDAELAVVENTDRLHHLVVCTLCSCYPTSLLGQPPDWYKSFAYRQRAVVEPRAVMREFGLHLGEDVVVRVVDSTADLRYLVLPRRPNGSEGMPEAELAELVTRDSMIGVGQARNPA